VSRLQHNPGPLRVAIGARRGEALGAVGWRCEWEDGRGRCRSDETWSVWLAHEKRAGAFCRAHIDRAVQQEAGE
jgi:hypothetical protein